MAASLSKLRALQNHFPCIFATVNASSVTLRHVTLRLLVAPLDAQRQTRSSPSTAVAVIASEVTAESRAVGTTFLAQYAMTYLRYDLL